MTVSAVLVLLLVSWIRVAIGQDFEGTGETSLGGAGRLVPFENDTVLATSGDDCLRVNLPGVGIDFKGNTYDRSFICANGMIRFKDGNYQGWPYNFGTLSSQEDDSCIAPYWARIDKQSFVDGISFVFFKKYEDRDDDPRGVFTTAADYAKKLLDVNNYEPAWVMTVTWKDLRPLDAGTFGGRNTFQVLITTDNTVAVAIYIYADIDWSVRALKKDYGNFVNDIAPVVGWNAPRTNGEYEENKQYSNFQNSGNVLIEEIDDERGNLDERGKFGIRLSKEDSGPNPIAECINWYLNDLFLPRPRCVRPCPPSLILALWFDDRFILEYVGTDPHVHICFITAFPFPWWDTTASRCCYRLRGGLIRRIGATAGSALRYHPNFYPQEHEVEKQALENCCVKSNFCLFYFARRRSCGSRGWFRLRWGWGFGDPHFQTLDGKNYTFNGCGWYTYFQGSIPNVANSSLTVQIRTTKVGDANATAFTGVVLKEGTSETVQVNLRSSGGLLILVNGEEFNRTTSNRTTFSGGITLANVDAKTLRISTPLGNGVRITEAANGTFLTVITAITDDYKNSSRGLSGYWNDNLDDDFLLPNGTILPANLSDSQIHYDFGEAWRVESGNKLYTNVSDDVNFKCSESFVPIFLDQALQFENSTLEEEARSVCGNDVNCLFDIAATGNTAIGQSTVEQVTSINNDVSTFENTVPYFTDNITLLNVTLGENFTWVFNALDEDGDVLNFEVEGMPSTASFNIYGSTLQFTWFVNSTDEVSLTFTVTDPKNGTSSFSPSINLCACQNGGICFVPEATSNQTAQKVVYFLDMECECPLGKTGRYCGIQKDFCESATGTVCHPLATCVNNPTNFTCGPCPSGYSGNGAVCADIDECITDNGGCEQQCSNSLGSFQCRCNDGFTLDGDKRTCNDIDECSRPNDCAQLCNNTQGSYECYCRIGFKVNPNNIKNCIASDLCEEGQNTCSQICYMDPVNPGQAKCECNGGFVLGEDGKSCQDVDECARAETNLCDQECINTVGSYNCSCNAGYQANGPYSCTDINECIAGGHNCFGSGEVCENIDGSFTCTCPKNRNLIRVNGTCIYKTENTRADPPEKPPTPTDDQRNNSIRLRINDFQQENWTLDEDNLFRESVVNLLNEFCNENRLRPQDCGVSQNQLLFNLLLVQRVPGFPSNDGNDAILEFYVNYPNETAAGPVPRAILASIISAQLQTLMNGTSLNLTLETSVVPESPRNPSADQRNNAVLIQLINFNENQWTTFYDTVFRRAVAFSLNDYCRRDEYTLAECQISGSETSFNQSHVGRLPGFPSQNGANVNVSFYVDLPSGSGSLLKIVLASILTTQRRVLQSSLNQMVAVITSGAPATPPTASPGQTINRVTVQISSFQADEWTYLNDQRFRRSVADRLTSYCNRNGNSLADCQITSNQAHFNMSHVQRTEGSPTQNGINADLSFYVNYPSGSGPVIQSILASIVSIELNAIQLQSGLTLTLLTSPLPPAPPTPSAEQLNNSVQIELLNTQADQWSAIQDNRLRAAIAAELVVFCNQSTFYLQACNVIRDQVSFNSSHVTRLSQYPLQNGNNASYVFFVDYPSGNGPLPQNLLAGILINQLPEIQSATGLQILVRTSAAATPPPSANATQIAAAVKVAILNFQASQWSAIQDNIFRGSVAQAVTEYCNVNDARRRHCRLSGGQTTFMRSLVQRVPGSTIQNGSNTELAFYVSYPNGGTLAQEILAPIMEAQLSLIQNNTGIRLSVLTIFAPPSPLPPTTSQNESAIEVQLLNFDVSQWSEYQDRQFRENMAAAIIRFCNTTSNPLELCNISSAELSAFNSSHIQRLPNSPRQNGSDAILAFYANLPSGTGTVSREILASVFASQQSQILPSIQKSLQTSPLAPDDTTPTPEQEMNLVPITVFDFLASKFTILEVLDIKITVARLMNAYCFGGGSLENQCLQLRRKKRTVTNQTRFSQDDVNVITNSIASAGNNTELNISVTYPGQATPVTTNVVQDALRQSFQQDSTSNVLNLRLGVVDIPAPTTNQNGNAVEILLINFSPSQWTTGQDLSFRRNLTSAIKEFCSDSQYHSRLCNLSQEDSSQLTYLNIQELTNSPSQNGSDTRLAYYVDLPSGGTMPKHILATIFVFKKRDILSQNSSLVTSPLPDARVLTPAQQENLVGLQVLALPISEVTSIHLVDIKESVAERMNEYCVRSSTDPCDRRRNFTSDDIHVVPSVTQNGTTALLEFYVNYPGEDTPISANVVSNILQTSFNSSKTSTVLGLNFTVTTTVTPSPTVTSSQTEGDQIDWPLILGLSIAGALVLIFVVLAIVIGVSRREKPIRFKDDRFDVRSMYSSPGWEFDRASPYSGSPFASIDAIPGFDEDGLPSEHPARDTQIY